MKEVTELHFYSNFKQCVSRSMTNERFREAVELFPDTPTMVVCDAPKQYCWNSCHYDPQSVAFCFACGGFFITGSEMFRWRKLREIHCPNCGRLHPIRNIRKVKDQASNIPLHIVAKISESEDKIQLALTYEAEVLTENPMARRKYRSCLLESFTFYTKEHTVSWHGPNHISYEIGFANDCQFFVEKSALNFLNWRTKSQEGPTFSAMLKTLRDMVNKHMKAQGKEPQKLTLKGPHDTLIIDSICNIAHQVRFWEAIPIEYYGRRISYYSYDGKPVRGGYHNWCSHNNIGEPNDFEQEILQISQKKNISYLNAFCKYFNLNIPRFAKKYVRYSNIPFIRRFYNELGVHAGNAYLPLVYEKPIEVLNNFYMFYRVFGNSYKNVPTRQIADFGCSKTSKDIMRCFNQLNTDNRLALLDHLPKFKELHDAVVDLLNKQRDTATYQQEHTPFNISEEDLAKFTKRIGQYQFEVLRYPYICKEVGKKLANCASGYAYRTSMGSTLFLVSVTDLTENKLIALLETTDKSLIQAKLFANKVASLDENVNSAVLMYAKLCKLKIDTRDIKPELLNTQAQTA